MSNVEGSNTLITKGSLLAGYLEFYFAKQRGGLDPLSLNDQERGTPPPPVSDNIPPNGSLKRRSDDQPWQSWGALFSDPDISVQL